MVGIGSMARSEATTSKKKRKKKSAAKPKTARRVRKLGQGGAPVVGVLVAGPGEVRGATQVMAALEELDVPCEVRVLSPHWTPDRVVDYARRARANGLEAIVACSGAAAQLGGMVAAHTTLPVVGVPMATGVLQGIDALLATVQTPVGAPVATVGVDACREAAFLVARILSGAHPELHDRLEAHRHAALERYDDADMRTPGQVRRTKKMW